MSPLYPLKSFPSPSVSIRITPSLSYPTMSWCLSWSFQMHVVSASLDLPQHLVSLFGPFPALYYRCLQLPLEERTQHRSQSGPGCALDPPLPLPSQALHMAYQILISVCWIKLNTLALSSVTGLVYQSQPFLFLFVHTHRWFSKLQSISQWASVTVLLNWASYSKLLLH